MRLRLLQMGAVDDRTLLSGGSWAQAPGTLDTTFALGNGKIPCDINRHLEQSSVKSVAIQRDGKILLFMSAPTASASAESVTSISW